MKYIIEKYGLIPIRENANCQQIHIFINGFMSEEENNNINDWLNFINHYINSNDSIYLYKWKCGLDYTKWNNHFKINGINDVLKIIPFIFTKINPSFNIAIPLFFISEWKNARKNSLEYGIKLSKSLESFKKYKINIYAHSLGASVVKELLLNLSDNINIENVYLFGGATNSEDYFKWLAACDNIQGKLFNFYTKNDLVLTRVYKVAELGETPIGLKPINIKNLMNLHNIDVSYTVNGHFDYKKNLPTIFRNLK